ncbi:MAG: AraC family transcriptional regulator [Sphingomonadales bacterium]|nr:AraC family transcriptional regulator [Sphingomonadales bacterium]
MAEVIRSAGLNGYLETMAALGVDPRPLLREHGLTIAQLEQSELLIPAWSGFRLLERSAEVTGCNTIGLRMAEGRGLASLGAPGLVIAHQPTLRNALDALTEYRARINSTLIISLENLGDEVVLQEDFSLKRPEQARQSSNLAIAVMFMLCRSILGANWMPLSVCFSHQVPEPQEMAQFVRIFRMRPQFNCEFNGLVFRKEDLDRPNAHADDRLAVLARDLLGEGTGPMAIPAVKDIERLVKLLLPNGRASIQMCAASLDVTVRTLQRMLEAEGDSFTNVLQRMRMQLATQYLSNPQMTVTDIAQLLGYASISTFTRWHAQAFGLPPLKRRSILTRSPAANAT